MTKDEIMKELVVLTEAVQNAKERLDALQKENEALRELVHHLASRPAPYVPVSVPQVNPAPWQPPFTVTC